VEVSIGQGLKNLLDVDVVFIEVITVDQNIIEIGSNEYVQVGPQDIVNDVLKAGRSVHESKQYY
jgi:3D (Asp-Asp-Asp) domain-containing protein